VIGKWKVPPSVWLALLGALSLLIYGRAYALRDLRQHTVAFVVLFFILFALYLATVVLILRHESEPVSRSTWLIIILFALAPRLLLLPMKPTLSDDMFRYVWDGRIQNKGLNPYQYPPNAPEVSQFRRSDTTVWPHINRKSFVTVYPPGAQMAFAAIWRVVGDSVTGFKAAFILAELVGAWLLFRLLRALGQPPQRVLIYLWSPLLIFEVAHAGHVDGLMLPFLILALWARVKERYWISGLGLGLAVLVKLIPLILLPALLPLSLPPSRHTAGNARWWPSLQMLLIAAGATTMGYLPYIVTGTDVAGFLPHYFGENFNMGLARIVYEVAEKYGRSGSTFANLFTFGGLLVLGLFFALKPAKNDRSALIRCVWLIGWFTLFTQNLFPWYLLWLLPLLACLVERGKFLGFRLAPMTAWLYFSGLIMLSYLFFVRWRIIPWAQIAEFAPLYVLLLAGGWFSRHSRGVKAFAGSGVYQAVRNLNHTS